MCLTSSCSKKEGATVYMTRSITPGSLIKIYEKLGVTPAPGDRVAVKVSFGEPGGHNYLQPALIADLVHKVNGTFIECNTAYGGLRGTTEDHLTAARDHGFADVAPIDIMDAAGEFTIPVRDSSYLKYDIVGQNLKNYDFMVNLAHFKGHTMGGFGGVLKNQSIGVASANGKAYQHSTGKFDTVEGFQAELARMVAEDPSKEASCWVDITYSHDIFHECMAACAAAVADFFGEGKIVYIDVMNNLSVDCDCEAHPADPEMNDIGILASLDPVALDQACVDLVFGYPSKENDDAAALIERITSRHGIHTVEHAEAIGLGTRKYKLVSID